MSNWIKFFKERSPFASYLLITMGPALSGYFLAGKINSASILISFIGFFLLFMVLRMMDEYKDYDKDVLAYPQRPLPRGLIPLPQFRKAITIGLCLLASFDILLLVKGHILAFYLYTSVIIHLWLMYKEFYCAEWINKKPLFYAFTHQTILITLCLFSISNFNPSGFSFTLMDWVYSLSVFFAFFSYEVCRKLNPAAHPVLKTYLYTYGIKGVLKIVTTFLVLLIATISYLFQGSLNQLYFYLPIFALFGCLVALSQDKISFKIVELVATINLLIFLYSGIFYVIAV
jgi:hypothetical protein